MIKIWHNVRIDTGKEYLYRLFNRIDSGHLAIEQNSLPHWDEARKSAVVESVMIRIPIGTIAIDTLQWPNVLLVGQGEIDALYQFQKDSFKLSDLEFIPKESGKLYSSLDKYNQRRMYEATIFVTEIQTDNELLKQAITKRITRKGEP